MANIYDVAKRARVSVATVSAVVNNSSYVSPALCEKVKSAMSELLYSPNLLARSLALDKSHTIGVLIPDITNPFYPEVVRGVEDKAREVHYTMILGSSDNQLAKEEVYLNLFLSKRVDGIVLVKAVGEMSAALCEKIRHAGPPIVLMGREYPHLQADTVVGDDCGGAYAAVLHLIKLGHRRIGLLAGIPGASTTVGRTQGYRKALESKGVRYDPALVAHGDYAIQSGFKASLRLLEQNPTAVFVANDLMTVGFMKALGNKGLRCPNDVAVVSYDDGIRNEVFLPKLTCVEQPKYMLGYRSAELLFSRILGKHKRPKFEVLKNRFRPRESCGRMLSHRASEARDE